MESVDKSKAADVQKALLKGGLAAAAPGLAAVTAAFTVPVSILNQYTGMGQIGVAALGVLFFIASFFLSRGHGWAGMPAIVITGWAFWVILVKAGRLLGMYYTHNPISALGDIFKPLPFISLQLTLLFIATTLGLVLIKAFWATHSIRPQPVNRFVWGAMGLWGMIVVLDCMDKLQ
jgi:hypothetical protein